MERRKFLKGAALAGAATTLAAPAVAQGKTEMVIVSTWPRDFPGLGLPAQRLAARISELTDGRIDTQYFAAGERVGAFDSFDEVASGNAQAYIGADYYWKGKHPGWAPFTAIPFGMTYTEIDAWIKYAGGQELWDELAGEFGLKNFAMGNTGVQMGGWFNKEINSPDDLKGLKMRIPGLGGDVMSKLGASPVSLPGGQIYENLVSGAIDATEWVGPFNDYFMKFYEAAKYYYWPGMHEPGAQLALGMNASWWAGLSKNDQAIIEAACNEENARTMAETNANNGAYLNRLINDHGVQLREFNDDVYEAFGEAAQEVIEEARDHSPLSAKIYDAVVEKRDELGAWTSLSDMAYVQKRNAVLNQ
ncbi:MULTISPECIES: TRAP transporter substrate-binding protein [unclassified Lentilitoribacter]|jgi:TRAP-type mannitol/chloroaromatic compound transport system substrate-binding protein|uniref:TRAP transporter substrate-binding protein n=1 Tax=unclassified Lentilitoribacter TaxID=2647570 RepID=UPI0013A6A314|nr:TRAP transporter substrate-binding protein [Lentilitoribacter sp. Alg239-R112]